jgi:RNA polymerase sigma-70 factor (ECF subfamily)
MANAKRTAANCTCKAKTACNGGKNLLSGGWLALAFHPSFRLNRGVVPADDEVTSQSAIGPVPAGHHSPAAFTTTHWSVVLEAQGESLAAQEALEKLCRIYWRPIYSFLRRQAIGVDDAQDLTQGFFALLLERRDLRTVRKEKGRLRSYLLTALKHFVADERRRAMAIKRGKGQRLIPLEELRTEEQSGIEPADPLSAERIYERRWASTLLDRVLSRLEDQYRTRGNAALFDSFNQLLGDEPGAPSQADIAAQLGMTENAVSQAFHRFRQSYQSLLREEIAHTVATPGDIESELRHLIAVIRA